MSMVCPQCNDLYDDSLQCPTCKARQAFESAGGTLPLPPGQEGWQYTPLGRIAVGLLVAQGLFHGLRMLCSAVMLACGDADPSEVWHSMLGLAGAQVLQAVGLLVGGALAGAARPRGALVGSIVGLLNGVLMIVLQQVNREPLTDLTLYLQPVLHVVFGTAGGLIATLIWKPLPTLTLASPLGAARRGRPSRPSPLFEGPVAWPRVLAGSAVVVAGILSARRILEFVLQASQGTMTLSTHLQADLATWEIIALMVLLGSGLAGMGTANGLKQGLCVGIGSGLILAGIHLGSPKFVLEHTILTLSGVLSMSVAGGWFACRLFPPLADVRQRASLSRLG